MPSTREQRGFVKSRHSQQQQNQRRQSGGKSRNRSGADSDIVLPEGSLLASILQCRPIPSTSGIAKEFNDIMEQVTSGYSSEEASSCYDDGEYSSDDSGSSGRSLDLDIVSRGRSVRSRRGTNSNRRRSDGDRRGRHRRRSPPPSSRYQRSNRYGKKIDRPVSKSSSSSAKVAKEKTSSTKSAPIAPPKPTMKPKKTVHVDDETAEKTRKRGNRRSDKKALRAENVLRSTRIPSFTKEEEEEDLKSDEENRITVEPRSVDEKVNRDPFSSHKTSGLANRNHPAKYRLQGFDQIILQGATKSTSPSSASSGSATSFTLNTNFHHANAAGRKTTRGDSDDEDILSSSSSCSISSSMPETEFSLNTMPPPRHSAVESSDDVVELCIPQGDLNIELENSSHGPMISEISAKTVAPALRVGDVIVALDGTSIDRFPCKAVLKILHARRTQPVRILKIKQSTSSRIHAILRDIEKTHISHTASRNSKSIRSAAKGLKIETGALSPTFTDTDEASLFTSVPEGMAQI